MKKSILALTLITACYAIPSLVSAEETAAAPTTAPLLQPVAGSAEDLLKQLNDTEIKPDRTRLQDQAYVAELRAKYAASVPKRIEIAKTFLEKYPNHVRSSAMLQTMLYSAPMRDDTDAAQAFLKAFIAKNPDSPATFDAMSVNASIEIDKGLTLAEGKPLVDAVATKATTDITKEKVVQLTVMLYDNAKDVDSAKRIELYKALITDNPTSKVAAHLKGKIAQVERIGKPFELSFTEAVTDKKISMADLKGKVVVIDFWATWCGPCVAEMPANKKIYAQYKDKGVEFIGVSLDLPDGGKEKLLEFVKKNEILWPQYYQGNGWNSEFSKSWGINAIPAVFIIDADGNLYNTEARGKLDKLIPELISKRDNKKS